MTKSKTAKKRVGGSESSSVPPLLDGGNRNDQFLWAQFDPAWYASQQPALDRLMADAGYADPKCFYEDIGCKLGHSPNPYFDAAYYLQTTPTARAAVDSGQCPSALNHFCSAADRGDAPHWLFSETYYRRQNPDLRIFDIFERFGSFYEHFLRDGDREWRHPHPFFDPDVYIANMTTERQAVDVRDGPYRHLVLGHYSASDRVRISWYFDPEWYLRTYPEVAREIASGLWSCALEHYLRNEHPTDFNPLAEFSELYYLDLYEEVRLAVERGEYRNGYDHFIKYGASENRNPHSDIDLGQYFAQVSVQSDIVSGRDRDAFAHLIRSRQQSTLREPITVTEGQSRELVSRTAATLMASVARRPLVFAMPSESNDAEVAVIMVVHNCFNLTLGALTSLRASYGGKIELHIIDSGSTDEVQHLDRYVRGAHIKRFRQNLGFVEGCNDALARIRAPYVLIINNDITIDFGSIDAALNRIASEADIGAVGGKIIQSNGLLQEAGCIIWRDGSTTGYLRDQDPNIPEANFVRDVDFCSAAFLLVDTHLARNLGGFDVAFRPGYFEETDFCLRLRQSGSRIVYDPSIVIRHYEFGTSSLSTAVSIMGAHHDIFQRKHRRYLKTQYPHSAALITHARSPQTGQKRILFVEDRIPLRRLGTGFTRSNDIVRIMADLGYHVTIYPIYKATENQASIFADFPDTVEVIYDRGLDELREFLSSRVGYFDVVWIARTHNVGRVAAVLQDVSQAIPINRIVLDTEAVAAVRMALRQKVLEISKQENLASAIETELASAGFCQRLVAVNERDAILIEEAGFGPVEVLGHLIKPCPTPRPFEDRHGLLFLGAIHDAESPNLDAVVWFVTAVLPLLEQRLPPETELTIAGYVNRTVDLTPLTRQRRVRLVGAVDNLMELYDQHRLFVAPLRYAAGIPYKLHEAASFGLPIVASELLRLQLDWTDRQDIISVETSEPQQFADRIMDVYDDPILWHRLRAGGLQRVGDQGTEDQYRRSLQKILTDMLAMKN